MIEAKKLSKTYQLGKLEVHALANVTFRINMGEFIAIMGPSGSGKSTLMNLLGCLDLPSSGSYLLEGIDISNYCIEEGKKILKKFNSNIVLKHGNAAKPNYKNKSFDVVFISGVAFDLTDKDLISAVTQSLRISRKYFILHISNYKLHPSLNIQSKGILYKSQFLRDYHLFFKENFARYEKKVIKLRKNIPELGKDITYANLDYLIILKVI